MGTERIYKGITEKVILSVCTEIDTMMGTTTDTGTVRTYKGRMTLNITMAKALSCLILHDRYGMSYNSISRNFGHAMLNIIKCVSRTRHFVANDALYGEIYRRVCNTLEQ